MNNIQEQEERDYNPQDPHQIAYQVSSMRFNDEDSKTQAEIDALVESGRFVVVSTYPAHCPITDAVLPHCHEAVVNHFDSREEAEACLGGLELHGDEDAYVVPREPKPEPKADPVDYDEVPF